MKLITAAQLFKALADRTRLRIVALLRRREMTGTELADLIRAPRGRIARHLRYLHKSWLVTTRRDGGETYYALRSSEHRLQRELTKRIIPLLEDVEQVRRDLVKLERR